MRSVIDIKFFRYRDAFYSKRAFTLLELLVVVGVIAVLMAILLPSLSRAKLNAKILAVNAELYGVGLALESYFTENDREYPPTRADCNPDARRHAYALPQELVDSGCLPLGQDGRIRFAEIEDKFNRGCSYKYIAPGPVYDYHGTPFGHQRLFVPAGFPEREDTELLEYRDPQRSPVSWVLFSVGPGYDLASLTERNFPIHKGFPVRRDYWYSPSEGSGILTRIRQRNGQHTGSFACD
jgi:prepilin-type N-terminal cleavage/methylation domain-containing protein